MRIYLAGGEAWLDLLLDMGVKNQLLSFFYFRQSLRNSSGKVRTQLARMKKAKDKGYSFMIDSGAFTYQVKEGHGLPVPRVYFEEYKNFLSDYGDLFDVVVEFDVDNAVKDPETDQLITTRQVDGWTDELIDLLGPKVMPVYHGHRGALWMQDWLIDTRSPLLGIGSDTETGIATRWIARSHQFGKFVHGFAQTRIKTDMKYTPFDSVDSTTWLRADKFGGTMLWVNDKLVVLDHLHKANRRIYKRWYESHGLNFDLITKDDLHENRMATIVTWREMSNAFEQKKFFLTGGKGPYLYDMHKKGMAIPAEHPLVTRMRRDKMNR